MDNKHKEICGIALFDKYKEFCDDSRCEKNNPYHMYPFFKTLSPTMCEFHDIMLFLVVLGDDCIKLKPHLVPFDTKKSSAK